MEYDGIASVRTLRKREAGTPIPAPFNIRQAVVPRTHPFSLSPMKGNAECR